MHSFHTGVMKVTFVMRWHWSTLSHTSIDATHSLVWRQILSCFIDVHKAIHLMYWCLLFQHIHHSYLQLYDFWLFLWRCSLSIAYVLSVGRSPRRSLPSWYDNFSYINLSPLWHICIWHQRSMLQPYGTCMWHCYIEALLYHTCWNIG